MAAMKPEDAASMVAKAMEAGDLDAVVDLYEPNASLVVEPGKTVTGSAAIREAMAGFIGLKPKLTSQHHLTVAADDLALVSTKWSLEGTGPDGKPMTMSATSTDVMRRQPDGSWKVIIDNPFGV